MMRRSLGIALTAVAWAVTTTTMALTASASAQERKPNIVFIMADDLGYGELGCYGQKRIRTPNIDKLASEGMRFRHYYAGSTVCAPSRSVLMTGLHTGHTRVRGNGEPGKQSLRPEDRTVAEMLKEAGYATGMAGKWGLGDNKPGAEAGLPNRQGFDFFFGYYNQHHAHNYYPSYLFRNEERLALPNEGDFDANGAGKVKVRKVYAHDLIADESLGFIKANQDKPFFLFCSWTLPHGNNEDKPNGGKDFGAYKDEDWPDADKMHAAMVSDLDAQTGRLLAALDEWGLRENTIVFFTSDNGPHRESNNRPEFFQSSGELRGIKRAVYDGGIRVPMIVRWPGRIAPASESDHVAYHGDLMATLAEWIGAKPPTGLDSVSYSPTLLGKAADQKEREFLYWEFYEGVGARAIRWRDWKGVRPRWDAPLELYEIVRDPGERRNVAASHPEIVKKLEAMMSEAHQDSPNWPVPQPGAGAAKTQAKAKAGVPAKKGARS